MNEQEIKTTLCRLLKNVAPDTEPETLAPDDNIRKTLGIDSFDYLQFIVAIDKAFNMQTPEEDYGKIETLDLLVKYIMASAHAAS